MQIRRKKKHSGSRPNNGLRVAILIIGCIALMIILLLSNFYEDGYPLTTTDSFVLRGESPAAHQRKHEMDNSMNAMRQTAEAEEEGEEEDADSDSRDEETQLPRKSLLHSPGSMWNQTSCEAVRHKLSKSPKNDAKFDESRPAMFSRWNPPALQKWADRQTFQSNFGSYAQYIKGRDVQPLTDKRGDQCNISTKALIDAMVKLFHKKNPNFDEDSIASDDVTSSETRPSTFRMSKSKGEMDLLFFTNDVENPPFLEALSWDYSTPDPLSNLDSFSSRFRVFSALERGSSHPFHSHGAAWLGQVTGSRLWYFLPPDTRKGVIGPKVNGCDYLLGRAQLPKGATTCVQTQGEVMYFPSQWLHSTCALEPWSLGIGAQGGNPNALNQNFQRIQQQTETSSAEEQNKLVECGVFDEKDYGMQSSGVTTDNEQKIAKQSDSKDKEDWTWYDGNLNEYYNKLEKDEHAKRDPNVITSYAVHRWMGKRGSTLVHYELVRQSIYELVIGQSFPLSSQSPSINPSHSLRVFDAGCGLGAGLMWFEQHEPNWNLVGHTISEEQHKWIVEDLPKHNFVARLHTYDAPLQDDNNNQLFNAVYSIEAAIHSPNLKSSIQAWSKALLPGGVIIIIDDFLSVGVARDDPDVDLFARSWIANAVHTTTEIANWADEMGMTLARDRDLGSEFQIIKRNYRNKSPELRDEGGRVHQGWLGSKVRQKLMVEGKISYRLIVLQKKGLPVFNDVAPKHPGLLVPKSPDGKYDVTFNK